VTALGERGEEPAVSLKTWIAVGGGLLGAFLAVLNIQITNASLPYIEGGIGTGGVYGTWISTAYLIGEIIVIPMTDFLSRVFSLRRYLIVNTALFLLFATLCGQASSLGEMIVLRILQGFAGGVMIPLAFTIVLTSVAGWMLQMRNVMITTISEDYVIAAQAKGLSKRRVIFTYSARNALLPQLQGFGLALGFVVSGALIMEIVFSYPGIGYLLLEAVQNKDFPLMQAIFLVITFAVLVANLVVDLIIVFFDPRARTREAA